MVFKTPQNPQLLPQSSPSPPAPNPPNTLDYTDSKDSKASPASGAHKHGGEADQSAPTESSLPPVQATGTQLTNSQDTHEVSCLCGLPENAGLLYIALEF